VFKSIMKKIILFLFVLSVGLISACKKNGPLSGDSFSFSTDTVLFDTVFTTIGSTTKRFKIYNENNGDLIIDEIQLMGGSDSPFRINLDGVAGDEFTDIEIPGKDSLFCFVEVTLDVNEKTYPFVVQDSIRFSSNGTTKYLRLVVWGRDAYFHVPEDGSFVVLVGDHIELWQNDKPHVLYGIVAVDKDQTLTIPAGTEIYAHKNAQLRIYEGYLNILGELGNEVTFQGDRLEPFYDDIDGQWGGVYLDSSKVVNISHTLIKNALVALTIDANNSNPTTVNLNNCFFDNSTFYNLSAIRGPVVTADNCVFGKAGLLSTYLYAGGEYHFTHCNFVNYWTGGRSTPAFAIQNWETIGDVTFVNSIVNSRFDNCIFYGNAASEFVVDTLMGLEMDFEFNACLIKREEIYEYANYSPTVKWNELPLFAATSSDDFHLLTGSPCIDAGDPSFSLPADIEGKSRVNPDIGAFEF
jgi:hypothetical protein